MPEADTPDGGAGRGDAPAGDDAVLPFQLDRMDLRGRVARLDGTLDQILTQHAYPAPLCALIGEAATITALIGQAMKLRAKFSIQARGEGAVRLIATDYFAPAREGAPARIRAYAQFDPEQTPEVMEDPYTLLEGGLFAMTIDQGPHMKPYQGLTPLAAGGLSKCAEIFFAQSEQVATRFHIAVGHAMEPGGAPSWRAGGVMLQHLAEFGEGAVPPDAPSGADSLMSAQDIVDMGEQSENWRRANMLLDTADAMELIGPHVSPERLLLRLFHEEAPRVYAAQPIAFGCTCAREKVEKLLRQYPETEVRDMTTPEGDVVADCQFCGASYRFQLGDLFGP